MNARGTKPHKFNFEGGMNRDTSFMKYPKNSYFETENFKLFTNKEGSFYDLENVDGTSKALSFTNVKILYLVEAVDFLILFCTIKNRLVILRVNKSFIYKGLKTVIPPIDVEAINKYAGNTISLIYVDTMTAVSNTIYFAKYNYENEIVQKIYWKDDNGFRALNVIESEFNHLAGKTYESTLTYTSLLTTQAEFTSYTTGNLKSGAYFYTYQLFDVNGLESAFAPLSDVVYISDKYSSTQYSKISGGKVGEKSSLGVVGKISNIDTSIYNRIRIVSVFYSEKTSIPIISIISERTISSNITFTDVGNSLGNLSSEELLFRNIILNPNTIEDKDGFLFLGAVDKKDYFDVDDYVKEHNITTGVVTDSNGKSFWESRMFSFGFDGTTSFSQTVKNLDNTDSTIIHFNNLPTLPKEHDCIYTGIEDVKTTECFAYKHDGTGMNPVLYGLNPNAIIADGRVSYGAYGKNIECEFLTRTVNINGTIDKAVFDDEIVSPTFSNGMFNDFSNPNNCKYLAIDYDEVDRYGIQFLENSTGRLSYVKWCIDLRSPSTYSFATNGAETTSIIRTWDDNATTDALKALYLKFTVRNIPTGLSWRIVRVPKEVESDYSNKSIGLLSNALKYSNNYYNWMLPYSFESVQPTNILDYPLNVGIVDWSRKIFTFISPDFLLNKDLQVHLDKNTNAFFRPAGYLDFVKRARLQHDSTYSNFEFNLLNWKIQSSTKFLSPANAWSPYSIDLIKHPEYSDTYMDDILDIPTVETGKFNNLVLGSFDAVDTCVYAGVGGTKLLLQDNSTYGHQISISPTESTTVGILKEDNFNVRYGGASYNDRAFNIYNPVSTFTTASTCNVYGTHYFGVFEYLQGSIQKNDTLGNEQPNAVCTTVWYPTISRRNLAYVSTALNRKKVDKTSIEAMLIQEAKGVIDKAGTTITQEEDYYQYNSVYELSRNMLEIALPKPFDAYAVKNNINITYSNYKIQGEYTDSWLKFNNKTISLDNRGKDLIALVKFKDRIYYFQKQSFGTLYIHERQNVTSADSKNITLGKGDVLEGYSQLGDLTGIVDKNHVVCTNDNIYWIDAINKEFRTLDKSGSIDLGNTIGMGSYFKSLTYNSTALFFDVNNKEVLIKINQGFVNFYIVYSEVFKKITGFINTGNIQFVNLDSRLFSMDLHTQTPVLYEHNVGEKCNLCGIDYKPSITLISNPGGSIITYLEVIELLMDTSYDSDHVINPESSEIIDSIRLTNSYQDVTLTPQQLETAIKTFRKHRINELTENGDKLLDYYTKIKITFKNDSNWRIILRDITVYFKLAQLI